MASGRKLLIIADIGGYTAYMKSHRMSLAHVEVNTARLLGKVIDAAPGFDLIEIEGDAAFLARDAEGMSDDDAVELTMRAALEMHRAFHLEREYVAKNLCPCNGCNEAKDLKLKFVAHVAEVATQTIRDRQKLVGIDVILVHRLLKNPVEVPEYVVLTEELYGAGSAPMLGSAREFDQEVDGIGPTHNYFVDVVDLTDSLPPLPSPTLVGRLSRTFGVAGAGMPYMLGLKRRKHATVAS